jgi:hypothetical protein
VLLVLCACDGQSAGGPGYIKGGEVSGAGAWRHPARGGPTRWGRTATAAFAPTAARARRGVAGRQPRLGGGLVGPAGRATDR